MDTERQSPRYAGIDIWDPADALDAMIEGQFAAVAAVRAARESLERAALAMGARPVGLCRRRDVRAARRAGRR